MRLTAYPLTALMAALAILTGCQGPGPYEPKRAQPYRENRDVFVLLNADLKRSITCAGIKVSKTKEGRLEVVANLRNLQPDPGRVEVDCVFKDALGFPTGEPAPFGTVYLPANGQEAARFTSRDDLARTFTVRVRKIQN